MGKMSFYLNDETDERLRRHIYGKSQGESLHGKLKEALNEAVKDYVDKVERMDESSAKVQGNRR